MPVFDFQEACLIERDEHFKILRRCVIGKSHVADWTSVSPTFAQMEEFYAQVKRGQITKENLQAFLRGDVKDLLSDFGVAHAILGDDFVSPEEVSKKLGGGYTKRLLKYFGATLPDKEKLRWLLKNGFLLIAGPARSLSVFEMCERHIGSKFSCFQDNNSLREDKVTPQWLMIGKKESLEEFSKKHQETKRIPNVAEIIWAGIILRE